MILFNFEDLNLKNSKTSKGRQLRLCQDQEWQSGLEAGKVRGWRRKLNNKKAIFKNFKGYHVGRSYREAYVSSV